MKKTEKKLIMNGIIHLVKKFSTLPAAQNYCARHNTTIIWFSAHEYYAIIK